MENILIKLKRLLNSIDDDELEDLELWIDNRVIPEAVALDDSGIVLLTELKKITIDGKEW